MIFPEDRYRSLGCTFLGWVHRARGDFLAAQKITCQALSLAAGASWREGVAKAYGNLGVIYRMSGDLDRAEQFHRQALTLEEAMGRTDGIAANNVHLGIINHERGNFSDAEERLYNGLHLYTSLHSSEGMGYAYGNLAVIYHARNDRPRMCDYGRKARDLWCEMGLEHRAAEVDKWLRANGCDAA